MLQERRTLAKPTYFKLDVKFTTLIVGQWAGKDGLNYTTLALGDDGKVYKYSVSLDGWEEMNHELIRR